MTYLHVLYADFEEKYNRNIMLQSVNEKRLLLKINWLIDHIDFIHDIESWFMSR